MAVGGSRELEVNGTTLQITDLSALAIETMPYSLRPILESVVRHVGADHPQVAALMSGGADRGEEVDLYATRVFLHDTNGVPALVDLAALRQAAVRLDLDPALVNPRVRAELVIDHSVIVDVFGTADAFDRNVEIEFDRNAERYRFLKWGRQAFDDFHVVPPGTGIMHQVNLEHLARVVEVRDGWAFPDVCLGTDSHTTMVDALGVLGWGVGGIEAEALMLGEPFSMVVPRVIGVRLTGALPAGSTPTDLVLRITELLREYGVVGDFVEFVGPAAHALTLADRATIANMCPEFGATCAYFPIDDVTLDYLRFTGRSGEQIALVEAYARAQRMWRRDSDEVVYADVIELDLSSIVPSIAGPLRPQDRVSLPDARDRFRVDLLQLTGHSPDEPAVEVELSGTLTPLRHGSVAIAAITSCTNTSNPHVMLTAGLLARNAVARGLRTQPWVKTSLSPGSRVVTDYLDSAGLSASLDELGFTLAGYGCMTCIGASGPLIESVETAVRADGVSVASVLSGNRNFEGRINPDVRLNYLASPPLVVAYALAGTMDVDLTRDPLGADPDGNAVFLSELWPSEAEVEATLARFISPDMFANAYSSVFRGDQHWAAIATPDSPVYDWDEASDYLRLPPYLDGMTLEVPGVDRVQGARVLAMLGDQITTDHLSPAGAIPAHTPAGEYLLARGVDRFQLNTYASRRGNHEVMMRGTLANVRLRNHLVPEREGGWTLDLVEGRGEQPIYDAAMSARRHGVPLIILGGQLYGAGSSRDWAAKGPALLGVRAVIAESFERIHRSNLIGMGILPLEYLAGESAASLGLTGREQFDISLDEESDEATVTADEVRFRTRVRLDTERERDYFRHGGILPYVIRSLAGAT